MSETDIDDTLLTISVQTNAGQQTLSRQAVEGGAGVEDATLEDLFRAHATRLDATLLNQATNGLTNVATSVAYTDGTPTTVELYPKVLEALAGVEGALLDQDPADNIAVMHSRRWYWMQNSVGSSWPVVQQPGIAPQMIAANYAEGLRFGLPRRAPNGTPVIVDNNIATNLGAGTNEDEIYIGSRQGSGTCGRTLGADAHPCGADQGRQPRDPARRVFVPRTPTPGTPTPGRSPAPVW